MNKKYTYAAFVLLAVLLAQLFPAARPAAAATCDWAQFVADISIADGTSITAGATFNKTWRLKNVGTCTWNTDYTLFFFSGEQMGAPAAVKFPKSVAPGGTVDLTVPMTAPNSTGTFRGNWKLKNAGGSVFGIGATANLPFWVEIRVNTGTGAGTAYDFVENAPSAVWTSGAGTLAFPGTVGAASGAGVRVDSPKLENGSTSASPGLLMLPQNVTNGFIQAQYPAVHVQSGDHFQSIINCEFNATACYVTFRLDYQIGSGAVLNLWTFNERYEGLFYNANIDLSSLAGQDVKFILCIRAAGFATGDRALWAGPRITRSGATSATNTPTVTVTGTPPTPTNTPVPNNGADRVTFIDDVNVPDGTVFGPNVAFTKTWKIKNIGTSTWTTAYKLVFVSDSQLNGPNEIPLTSTVGPNTSIELSVNLTSPSTNGRFKGFWMLQNAGGARFGLGSRADQPWWVEIVVSGGSNFTATPTFTGTPPTRTPTPPGPTRTPTPNRGPDRATFVEDRTIPDGTRFGANAAFTKTWRIKNTGTSTWSTSYKLVFDSGDQMGGAAEVNLPSTVSPGATVDLSVTLTAPAANANDRTYRGYWMLKNTSGQRFGIGATANRPFWVDIVVTGSGITTTPTPTVTKTLVPGTPSATPTMTITSVTSCNRARMVADVNVPDGTIFPPSTAFTKTWRIQNVGTCTWSTEYKLVFVSASQMGGPSSLNLPSAVAPNATIDISVNLTSPAVNGTYRGNWEFKDAAGGLFGIGSGADIPFWVEIVVQGPTPTATLSATPTLTPTLTPTPTITLTPTTPAP